MYQIYSIVTVWWRKYLLNISKWSTTTTKKSLLSAHLWLCPQVFVNKKIKIPINNKPNWPVPRNKDRITTDTQTVHDNIKNRLKV